MDLDKEITQRILDKFDLGTVQSVVKETSGITGDVFRINNQYILKTEGGGKAYDYRIERNVVMCDILEKNEIAATRVIAADVSRTIIKQKYILLTHLKGDNLNNVWDTLPQHEQRSIAIDYGTIMARIHQIEMKKFGDIVDNRSQHNSWYDFIIGKYKRHIEYVERNGIMAATMLNQVKEVFNEHDKLFRVRTRPVLLHVDFSSKNIKYYQGKLNGIFDFDESLGGHNEFDFTKVFLPYKIDRLFSNFILEGYKRSATISDDFYQRVRLYSLSFLINVLWFSHENGLITPALNKKYTGGIEELIKEVHSF